MNFPGDLSAPLDENEIDELDAFLLALEDDEAIYGFSAFDGFVTAIVSGPDMIPPSEWLGAVWGSEDSSPVWEDEQQFQHIFGLMIRHMNSTAATLMEDPLDFEPYFLEGTLEGENILIVTPWCAGYMKGLMLRPNSLRAAQDDMTELLGTIPLFGTEANIEIVAKLDDTQMRSLQDQIAPAARAVHAYWLDKRSPAGRGHASYVRAEPKTGRNDPCPCGSGKKHKKCCGLH